MSSLLPLIRKFGLAITICDAFVILALAASTLDETSNYSTSSSAVNIAFAALHLISVCVMIIVGFRRSGTFTSKVSTEVGWLSWFSILWLATGVVTVATPRGMATCSTYYTDSSCAVILAIAVLCFLNLLILLVYVIALTVAAIQAGKAGKNIWSTEVKEVLWSLRPTSDEENNDDPPNPTVTPPGSNPSDSAPPSVVSQS